LDGSAGSSTAATRNGQRKSGKQRKNNFEMCPAAGYGDFPGRFMKPLF
jgi:hypothetical protein